MEATESSHLLPLAPTLPRWKSFRSELLETKSASQRLRSFSLPSPLPTGPNATSDAKSEQKTAEGGLAPLVRLGYAFGHAQNDLCAAMYFSYLLVYLEGAGMSPVDAGTVLIVGQIVDGCATPLVGLCSDRWSCFGDGCCWGLAGRRKAWYIGGLALVTATFWMLFTPPPLGVAPVAYYAGANSLFQVGWASVQVSHMSMVPEITPHLSERTFLNAVRYAVTVATSIAVYMMLLLFQRRSDRSTEATFQAISYLVLAAGAVMGVAFVALVRETKATAAAAAAESDDLEPGATGAGDGAAASKTLGGWFRTPGYFGVTANYAFARLCGNTFQMYLPFYVMANMPARPTALSTVPLVGYAGMILSSAAAPRASALVPDALRLCAWAAAIIAVGSTLLLLADPGLHAGAAYLAAFVLGVGGTQLMVASQTQVCELVGDDPCGGVVFGICSLCDKISTALVIAVIQRRAGALEAAGAGDAEGAAAATEALGAFYRVAVAGGPLACALLACASLLTVPMSIRDREWCGTKG